MFRTVLFVAALASAASIAGAPAPPQERIFLLTRRLPIFELSVRAADRDRAAYIFALVAPDPKSDSSALQVVLARMDTADGRDLPIRWTSEGSCPAVSALVDSVRGLRWPTPYVWRGPPSRPPLPAALHSDLYVLRLTAAQGGGDSAQLQVSANSGELADWARRSISSLDRCWNSTPPLAVF